jgi:hypothetical protein
MADHKNKIDFLIKPIKYPLTEDENNDWQVFPLFNGMFGSFKSFSSHISALKPDIIPHSPHAHMEEEIIIPLRGNVEILTSDQPTGSIRNTLPLEPGSFVYHSSGQFHTIRCSSSKAAQYLVFKWRRFDHAVKELGTFAYDANDQEWEFQPVSPGFRRLPIAGLTDHTNGSLRAHISLLEPNTGYPAHQDNYDILVVLLEGELETFNLSNSAPAIFFFAANTPHGFFNLGTKPARYFVFEFN